MELLTGIWQGSIAPELQFENFGVSINIGVSVNNTAESKTALVLPVVHMV